MAFAIDKSDSRGAKRGLILASRKRTNDIQLIDGTPLEFTISGNALFMDNNSHQLASLNESRLSIAKDGTGCTATLNLQSISSEHSLTSNPVGQIIDPVSEPLTSHSSSVCTLNGGQVELQFTISSGPFTGPLILRGFAMNEDGALGLTVKQINLLWLQNNALGLVFAQLDQGLSAEFEN
jgi:hypothetical protein